ncbi:MAG: hypothetical protein ACYDA9_15170 [Terriglobia bacterium]
MRIPLHPVLRAGMTVAVFVCAVNASSVMAKDPPSDNCSLLAPAQLQKTLGQPFSAPQKSVAPAAYAGLPSGSQCEYSAQKGAAVKVVFIAFADPSAAVAKQTFDKLSAWYTPKSKPAIGDSAYIDSKGAIHVLKGKVRFYIAIEPAGTSKASPFMPWLSKGKSDTPAQEKQLKDLAVSVAARI